MKTLLTRFSGKVALFLVGCVLVSGCAMAFVITLANVASEHASQSYVTRIAGDQ